MATMKDVAQRAGVGVGTVSRVINHVPGVKESTLIKVNQAIKELNYIPDEYARGLKTKSSRTIALILPSVWHPFFSEFAYYVEKRLDKEDYYKYSYIPNNFWGDKPPIKELDKTKTLY